MEDLPVKAIVIGVSVFVTMAVLSAIMIYFNTARSVADAVNKRADIADNYESIMDEDISQDILTGVEVRSLIIKYAGSDNVKINIVAISGEEVAYNYVNKAWYYTINYSGSNKASEQIISEAKLDLINPVWNCKASKVNSGDITTLNIELDVDNTEEE